MAGPLLAAAAPAAIAGVSSLIGGAIGNRAGRKEAERNRQFQERMRSTAWQTAVADMEAAGINPALAYSQGPASTPGGSMASQADVLTPAVSSAMQAERMKADLRLLKAQTDKVKQEGRGAKAAADTAVAKLAAYGISVGSDGSIKMRIGDDAAVPLMTRELMANVGRTEAQARRETEMGRMLGPGADFAERLGEFLPLIMLLTQMNPGGLMRRGANIRNTRGYKKWLAGVQSGRISR